MEAEAVVPLGLLRRQKAPCLVFFSHGKRRRSYTLYSISEGRCYVRNIPKFRGKQCHLSSNGWLWMEDFRNYDISIINATSMETIDFPPLPPSLRPKRDTSRCILSGPPTDPTCVLLFMDYFSPAIIYWHWHHQKWNEIEYKLNEDGGIFVQALLNGKIYGLTHQGTLTVVEFNPDPVLRVLETAVPCRLRFERSGHQRFLVESCGEIFLVCQIYVSYDGVVYTLEVLKLDVVDMKFVTVDSLSDRAFFLQYPISVSCCASECGVKAGCIYYLLPEDSVLYRFDMADRSISMDVPWPNLSTPWSDVQWVMPSSE